MSLAIESQERASSVVKAKTAYGSLTIKKCKFCGGKAVLSKGRYKAYMFCNQCDKVYKVKQRDIMAGSMLVNRAR